MREHIGHCQHCQVPTWAQLELEERWVRGCRGTEERETSGILRLSLPSPPRAACHAFWEAMLDYFCCLTAEPRLHCAHRGSLCWCPGTPHPSWRPGQGRGPPGHTDPTLAASAPELVVWGSPLAWPGSPRGLPYMVCAHECTRRMYFFPEVIDFTPTQ